MVAKAKGALGNKLQKEPTYKKTSQGRKNIKTSTMNKHKRRSYKKYRGQGG